MNTFDEFSLTGPSLDSIISFLMCAVKNNKGWSTNEEHNKLYTEMAGVRLVCLIPPQQVVGKSVSVALRGEPLKNGKARMRVTNVFPEKCNELISEDESNLAVSALEKIVDAAPRDIRKGIKIHYRKGEWTLEDVIPGKTARNMFNEYLQGSPRTFHQTDVERLDFFTIALFTNKSKTNPRHIERYLVEDIKWSESDAGQAADRITVGLQVLAAHRKYWKGI